MSLDCLEETGEPMQKREGRANSEQNYVSLKARTQNLLGVGRQC